MDDDNIDLAERFEDKASLGGNRGGSRRGGNRRGGGGGRGGGKKPSDSDISRALSRLLRHQAQNAGIRLDAEGYAPLDRVLQYGPIRSLGPSVADIRALVATNDKQRFAMKLADTAVAKGQVDEASDDAAHWLIRANQGHSIKIESAGLLRPIALDAEVDAAAALEDPSGTGAVRVPRVVVHGTYIAFWRAIVESGGLKRMGRNHLHCSTGLPKWAKKGPLVAGGEGKEVVEEPEVKSGMRRDAEILVHIDVERTLKDGAMTWWLSSNGVVLTEGDENGVVPLKYFKEVVGREGSGVGVLWKDGEMVAELPEGMTGKTPPGKHRGGGGAGRGRGGRGRGRA